MKQGSTFFLRAVVFILGGAVLATCIFALPPAIISDKVGGYRPILLGLYVTAIPFFVALHQALKLLSYIDSNTAFSTTSVHALQKITYCAIIISACFTAGMPYIYMVAELDDAPGVIAIALVIIAASVVIAVFAALLKKLLQNAIEIKSENDLTV